MLQRLFTATKLFFILEQTEYDIEDKGEPLNKRFANQVKLVV
jgi:hypothetical protein